MRRSIVSYGIAAAALVASVLLRWLLDPLMGDALPLVTLFGAVAAAVWSGGHRPALLVMALGYAACAYLFIPPRGELSLGDSGHLVGLVAYVFTCSIIIAFGEAMRAAQRRAEERGEVLRLTLGSIGDGLITTDGDGRVASLNAVAEALTGWTQGEAAGQPLGSVFRIFDEQTREPIEHPAQRAIREGRSVGLASHTLLVGRDGTERAIDDSAAPIRNREGQAVGCVLVFRDVTERRELERQSASRLVASRLFSAIVESSTDAIISKSLDGTIQSWNVAAERLFGYSAAEAVGRNISLIIPADRTDEEALILGRIRAGERIEHFDTVRTRQDGEPVHISLTVSPVRDEEGRIIGASKVARDITDRKQAEERIYQLLADLKDGDRRKDEFLAILAHELRGPLAPLHNALEIMKGAEGDADRIQATDAMERQLRQLVRLVDELLDLSRVSRDHIELRRERVELAAILQQAVEACRPLSECARQVIGMTSPDTLVLYADPVRLTQVFTNLVHNACKYSEPGGQISVAAARHGDHVVVTVRDRGIGIPPDQLVSIFEMFTQLDRTLERSQGGLGIGLTLVKRLVELHGGSVTAHSEGPGRGSEFVVRLPILLEGAGTAAPEPPRAEPRRRQARRFLVVDDNADAASSLATLLRVTGHETQTAHDGLEAVEAAEKFRPDVVLLDIGLPRLNGYDVCRKIREQPWGRDMVLVALTGWGQREDRRKAMDAGFDHHMVKPMDFAALMKFLAEEPARAGR